MNENDQHGIFREGAKNFEIHKKFEVEKYYLSETIKLSIVTGPLYLLSANLQYFDKNLIQSNFISISKSSYQNGKKVDLLSNFMLKNTIENSIIRPFRPSYYINYREAVLNIFRQGNFALYKGNLLRLSFFISSGQLKKYTELNYGKYFNFNNILKDIFLYGLADIFMHPLLFLESRFSIQPYKKGRRIYNSPLSLLNNKSFLEIYKGSLLSIPRNILFVLSLNSYYIYPEKIMNFISVSLAHILSYPILTIQRNVIFRSNRVNYLPNNENTKELIKSIYNNIGFFGFYRGFGAYALATGLWHYIVPSAANQRFYINLLAEEKSQGFMDFKIFNEAEDEDNDDE
jgi:hypothetical protein